MSTRTKAKIAIAFFLLATLAAIKSFSLHPDARPERRVVDEVGSAIAPPAIDEGTAPRGTDGERSLAAESGSISGHDPARRVAEGIVVDLSAATIPDVPVVFRARGAEELRKDRAARSDSSGRFRLEIPEGSGSLTAGEGSWVGVFEPRVEETGPVSGQHLVVAPVRPLSGLVVDDRDAPISFAQVTIELPGSPSPIKFQGRTIGPDNLIRSTFPFDLDRCATAQWKASSDSRGEFSIENAPGIPRAEVHTSRIGYADDVQDPPLDGSKMRIVLHRPAESGTHLRGRVVDAREVPVPGASVFLGSLQAGTADDGRFDLALADSPSGDHIVAVKEGWLPVSQPCLAPSPADAGAWPDPLVLVLKEETLLIRGYVVDSQGKRLTSFRVRAADPSTLEETLEWARVEPPSADGVRGIGFGGRDAATQADGSFVLRSLAPRIYHLRAVDIDSLAVSPSIAVQAGSTDVRMCVDTDASYPCVAGEVVDSSGNPMAGIRVLALRKSSDGEERSAEIKTDSEGRFRLQRLSRDADTLAVWPERIVSRRYRIEGRSDLCDLRLIVPRPGDLKIELTAASPTADSFAVLDEEGARLQLEKHWGNGSQGPYDTIAIVEGSSDWALVPDDAATVVLLKDGNEVLRRSVRVRPGELNLVKL